MSSVTNQGGLHSKVLFAFVCMLYACSGACVCVCVGGSELVALCSTMWALDIELRFLRLVRKGLYVLSCEVWIPLHRKCVLRPAHLAHWVAPVSTAGRHQRCPQSFPTIQTLEDLPPKLIRFPCPRAAVGPITPLSWLQGNFPQHSG